MMMAQPFPAHQVGMAHHPGLAPGHPMPQGQHPNAAHLAAQNPGAAMVPQLHAGVSTPGAQVTQSGPMAGGMQQVVGTTGPGGPGPNAHALSHLGPAHSHQMFQPQHMQNFGNNPQFIQQQQHLQQQQQQFLRQRQHQMIIHQQQQQAQQQAQQQHQQQQQQQQHQQAQQQQQQQQVQQQQAQQQQQQAQQAQQPQQPQHAGIPASMPNGTQPVSAAHMAAVQAANPTGHMRAIPTHLQQQLQGHHGQPQNIHQQQQQHLYALQMAQANNSVQPNQQQTPQQRTTQPQAMSEAQAVPAHTQPPPQSQGSLTPSQQAPAQTPTPQGVQQTQVPQQQGQTVTSGQMGQQPGQPAQLSAQDQQLRMAHGGGPMMIPPRMPNPMKGTLMFRLLAFSEHLSSYSNRDPCPGLPYWQQFVEQFYSPSGVLRQGVWNAQCGSKKFELSTPTLARYYWTHFTSGVKHMQMIVENAVEKELATGYQVLDSNKAYFIYWFENGTQLVSQGVLRAQYDPNGKIEMLDIDIKGHNEYLPRNLLQPAGSPDQKASPKVGKTNKRQKLAARPGAVALPESMVADEGVTERVLSFLEIAETMTQMQTIFQYSQNNPNMTPPEALRQLVNNFAQNPATAGFAPNHPGQPTPGQRTPGLNGPVQYSSPAAAQLGIPGMHVSPHVGGSTHTPSPAQNPIPQAVAMAAQQSQQGTNTSGSQGTSANASPSVSNKRRRASTVKMEGEDGGPPTEINGNAPSNVPKVKASPRVGGKRQKGTA